MGNLSAGGNISSIQWGAPTNKGLPYLRRALNTLSAYLPPTICLPASLAPGTGKTMLAKAVAHHTTASFIRVVGSEFVQKYLGEVRPSPREDCAQG